MNRRWLEAIAAGMACLPCLAWGGELHFRKHLVDTQIAALGADVGDRLAGGRADLVACDGQAVYWYDASGGRHVIEAFQEPALVIHLRCADIDRDGDRDVVAADHRNGRVLLYLNPGEGPAKQQPWPRHLIDTETQGTHAVAVADLNGDGWMDVVASGEAEATPPNTLFWFEHPRSPRGAWRKRIIGPSGGLAHYPAVGDVNGDGRPDVVHAAKQGEWFRLYVQPARAGKPWRMQEVGSRYIQATHLLVGDVNGDGKPDLIGSQGHHFGVLWFEAPHWQPHSLDQSLRSPHTLAAADLDGDGDLDVITCAFESTTLSWFENLGKGRFRRHDIVRDQAAYDLVAADIDGDGDLDLLLAGQNSKNVCWFEQVPAP